MGKCGCGEEFQDGWEWLCRTCNPTSNVSVRVEANTKDGSSIRKMGGGFVSQRYYDGLSKRTFKKSEKARHEDGELK
jgi:hypothetical protein